MTQYTAFVRKEFRHIFRDRWTTIILLLLPVVMLILFGYAINTEVKNANFVVYDPARDDATRQITELLDRSDYFVLTRVLRSPGDIDAAFDEGDTGMAVAFGGGFGKDSVHGGDAQVGLILDATDPNTALTLSTYATGIIDSYRASASGKTGAPYAITPSVRLLYNPEMKGAYNFVPGVMGMVLMLVCAIMTSISIAREKETGTMEVLLVSPMKPLLIILAKVVPYLALSCVNFATILALAVFLLGVPVAGNFAALLALSLAFIVVSLALGILISSVAETQVVALLVSGMGLMMPTILLSGMMFPVENMPWFLRLLSDLIPARWYIAAVRKVMIMGLGFPAVMKELGILSLMAVALISVSRGKFKVRLE